MLARKALALEMSLHGRDYQPLWRQIELAADLFIRSTVVVAPAIDSLVARDVVIFRNGTLNVRGAYLMIACRRLSGETPYWRLLKQSVELHKQVPGRV